MSRIVPLKVLEKDFFEKLFYLFPKLKEIKNISFIRWKEYDE